MRIHIKSFVSKKDLPFNAPQSGEFHEVTKDGEFLMLKTSDGHDLALAPVITDNEYFTAEIEAVITMDHQQMVEFVKEQTMKVVQETETKKEKTVEMLNDLLDYDITLMEPFHDLLSHIDKTYQDKYEADPYPALDLFGLRLGGTPHSTGFNVGSAAAYLKRYLTTGHIKSYNPEDLLKSIHFLLFELYSRSNNDINDPK